MKRGRNPGRGDAPGQFQIDWSKSASNGSTPSSPAPAAPAPVPLVQYLKWNFTTTFPRPTPDAIDAGVISDEDATPQAIRAIHDEHAREALAVLHDLDVVMEGRRRSVDPRNNKPPRLEQARERLQKFFVTEPARLEHWWQNLMDVYKQSFGAEAADAFAKALRARHAGIPVRIEPPLLAPSVQPVATQKTPIPQPTARPIRPQRPRHIAARLPVPRPLASAVAAGRFGQEENGKPVRPGAREVREITEQHAEKLIELLDSMASAPADSRDAIVAQFMAGISAYAEDFGPDAAEQLEAYARRQAGLDPGCRRGR
jgi:hypothetical protein